MNLLLELVSNAVVTGTVVGGVLLARVRNRAKKTEVCPFGSIPWSSSVMEYGTEPMSKERDKWGSHIRIQGIKCPKCKHHRTNNNLSKYCECELYMKEHYHFECNSCGYKAIMRTADDE